MRATIDVQRRVSRATKKIVEDPPLLRRYTSPCGVSFETPGEAIIDHRLPTCRRCGSREWDIDERPWGGS